MSTKVLSFADLSKDVLLAICDELQGDGHGVYDPAFLTRCGVPDEYVCSVTHTYKSDGTYKGTIFVNGQPVPEVTAVYSLSLYRRINRDLGLPGSTMGGRGSEARQLDAQIREHLA